MARHLFLAALALTCLLGATVTDAKSPTARTTILDEPAPTTEAGKDAACARIGILYETSVMAALCKIRSDGWGDVLKETASDAMERVFGKQCVSNQAEHCYCGDTLATYQAALILSWKDTPEEDCAEDRANWTDGLREGDAIVKKLRPNGVSRYEGLYKIPQQ